MLRNHHPDHNTIKSAQNIVPPGISNNWANWHCGVGPPMKLQNIVLMMIPVTPNQKKKCQKMTDMWTGCMGMIKLMWRHPSFGNRAYRGKQVRDGPKNPVSLFIQIDPCEITETDNQVTTRPPHSIMLKSPERGCFQTLTIDECTKMAGNL